MAAVENVPEVGMLAVRAIGPIDELPLDPWLARIALRSFALPLFG